MSDDKHTWSSVNRLQLGKYAEYLVKMEFVLCGCDVFTAEVGCSDCTVMIEWPERKQKGAHG